jgi:hypothetical protein
MESAKGKMTAEELYKSGKYLASLGHFVVFLYPTQEYLAVEAQIPFLRYGKIPHG